LVVSFFFAMYVSYLVSGGQSDRYIIRSFLLLLASHHLTSHSLSRPTHAAIIDQNTRHHDIDNI
jgi:hypothetical protein